MNIKLIGIYFAAFLAGSIVILGIFVGAKWFNQATMQTKVITPKIGVECVIVSTTSGASIDCYKAASNG